MTKIDEDGIDENEEFLMPGLIKTANYLKTLEGCEKLAAEFDSNKKLYFKKFMEAYLSRESISFAVLNHGDFHGRNLMYRNDGDLVEDLCFVSISEVFMVNTFIFNK